MRFLAKLIVLVLANAIGFWVAAKYIAGFTISDNIKELLIAALIFTVLNSTLKPILKLVLGPIVVLTLGFGLILVNALLLYILDIFSAAITIQGITPLVYATLIIGAINFIFHLATKK